MFPIDPTDQHCGVVENRVGGSWQNFWWKKQTIHVVMTVNNHITTVIWLLQLFSSRWGSKRWKKRVTEFCMLLTINRYQSSIHRSIEDPELLQDFQLYISTKLYLSNFNKITIFFSNYSIFSSLTKITELNILFPPKTTSLTKKLNFHTKSLEVTSSCIKSSKR